MPEFRGEPTGRGRRVCVVVSRFNSMVTERLLQSALGELEDRGVPEEDVDVVRVPGAWELTSAVRRALDGGGYDAIVALGAVVRGQTPHFEYLCRGVTAGLASLCAGGSVPIAFGVLTTDDLEQALARAGGDAGDKGVEAASAALEMADLHRRMAETSE